MESFERREKSGFIFQISFFIQARYPARLSRIKSTYKYQNGLKKRNDSKWKKNFKNGQSFVSTLRKNLQLIKLFFKSHEENFICCLIQATNFDYYIKLYFRRYLIVIDDY